MHADADALTRNNLLYREPRLYDELLADSSLADELRDLAAREGNGARSVLDLGCGTARLLGELFRQGIPGAGVDLQPGLIAWARREHPALWLEVGDLRTARLDATFDLIVCVGNTLAYLHAEADLAAAFATAAAHSHPGTQLAVATLTGSGRAGNTSEEVNTSLGSAIVDTTSEWHPATSILTTKRAWRFAHGRVEHDTMRRRFWRVDTLGEHARAAGFQILGPTGGGLTMCATFLGGSALVAQPQ